MCIFCRKPSPFLCFTKNIIRITVSNLFYFKFIVIKVQCILFPSSFLPFVLHYLPLACVHGIYIPLCADCSGILCWPCSRSALKSSQATPSTLFSATSTEMRRTVWTGTVMMSHRWEKILSLPHWALVLLGPLRWGKILPLWVFVSHWESYSY